MIPFFWLGLYKTRRDNKTWLTLKYIEVKNYMVFSCADIENLLWSYGIQTHPVSLEDNGKTMTSRFLVSSDNHFFADVILRQNEQEMCFIVETPIVKQNGTTSNKYSKKKYKPLGIPIKHKSIVNVIGNLLFGHKLKKKLPMKAGHQSAKNRQKKNITS